MKLFAANFLTFLQILALSLFRFSKSQTRFYTTKTATKCFAISRDSDLLFSPCKPGHLILIEEAFQGTSQNQVNCEYQWGDCIMPVTAETEARLYKCVGADKCSMPVTQAWLPKCDAYSSYISVMYKCIAKEDISDICHTKRKQIFRNGYVKSYKYPDNYDSNLECHCNITTEFNQKILLSFTDFAVEWSENCFSDVLEIRDGFYEYARCGRIPRNHNITSQTNKMQIIFKTDTSQEHKGFWLRVEALGNMDISCASINGLPMQYFTSPEATSTTTLSETMMQDVNLNTKISTREKLRITNPTNNKPIFGGTPYKVNTDDNDESITTINGVNENKKDLLSPTLHSNVNPKKRLNGQQFKPNGRMYDRIDKQLDILLSDDFLNPYVTGADANSADGFVGNNDYDFDDGITGPTTKNKRVKPSLVISPTTGIIIACVLLVIILMVLICVCVWKRRHRKKKHITKSDRNEPRLTKHNFPVIHHTPPPHLNSPLPTTSHVNTSRHKQYIEEDLSENYSEKMSRQIMPQYQAQCFHQSDNLSDQYNDSSEKSSPSHAHNVQIEHLRAAHHIRNGFPDSPASARSYDSENSLTSVRSSGLKRGERVKKQKRIRMSPRLDLAHYQSGS